MTLGQWPLTADEKEALMTRMQNRLTSRSPCGNQGCSDKPTDADIRTGYCSQCGEPSVVKVDERATSGWYWTHANGKRVKHGAAPGPPYRVPPKDSTEQDFAEES